MYTSPTPLRASLWRRKPRQDQSSTLEAGRHILSRRSSHGLASFAEYTSPTARPGKSDRTKSIGPVRTSPPFARRSAGGPKFRSTRVCDWSLKACVNDADHRHYLPGVPRGGDDTFLPCAVGLRRRQAFVELFRTYPLRPRSITRPDAIDPHRNLQFRFPG